MERATDVASFKRGRIVDGLLLKGMSVVEGGDRKGKRKIS